MELTISKVIKIVIMLIVLAAMCMIFIPMLTKGGNSFSDLIETLINKI